VALLIALTACGDDDAGSGGADTATTTTTTSSSSSSTAQGAGGTAGDGGAGGQAEGGSGGTLPQCGDGVRDAATEACDDGDTIAGDGCSDICAIELILDQGHIDLFEITYDEPTNELVTRVKDTTALYTLLAAYHRPADVTIDIDETVAAVEIPPDLPPEFDFLGPAGSLIYLLDQVQQPGLPWPGWSTERLLDSLPVGLSVPDVPDAVRLAVEIQGPGDVFTFETDGFGLPTSRYIDTVDPAPDVIPMTRSAHSHTAWVFTEVGEYALTATPELQTSQGIVTGPPELFRFHVGAPLIPSAPAAVVTVEGGSPPPYVVGETVELQAMLETPISGAFFNWYSWVDHYELVPDEHAAVYQFSAVAAGEWLYTAAVVSPSNGRILGVGATMVQVE
jgi:cysteine-rich repeat protein